MSWFEFLLIVLLSLIVVLLSLNYWQLYKSNIQQESKKDNVKVKNNELVKSKSSDNEDDDEVIDLRRRRNSGSSTGSWRGFPSTSSHRDYWRADSGSTCSLHQPVVSTIIDPSWQLQNFQRQNRPRYGEDSIDRLARALRPHDDPVEDFIDLASAALPPAIRLFSGMIRRANNEFY